ncbi:Hypothetical predicted protein [Marmota monax]|uniref:Uncharacterized protein n=1 Tax=Marmota monax TaxID=9995 RepID=A0A5E4BZD0_MARMO|nr:hypothetical protein GHT09_001915 [Marmota monax]VTJ74963.1 Hypothetical predicted protein [Marmota monax]
MSCLRTTATWCLWGIYLPNQMCSSGWDKEKRPGGQMEGLRYRAVQVSRIQVDQARIRNPVVCKNWAPGLTLIGSDLITGIES